MVTDRDMSVSLPIFGVTSKQTLSKQVAGHTTQTQRARVKKTQKNTNTEEKRRHKKKWIKRRDRAIRKIKRADE